MSANLVVIFNRLLKKPTFNVNGLWLFFLGLLFILVYMLYDNFTKVRHNTEEICVNAYGNLAVYCDSIVVDHFAYISTFAMQECTEEINNYPKAPCLDFYIEHVDSNNIYVDSLIIRYYHMGEMIDFDSLKLSDLEIEELCNKYNDCSTYETFSSMMGALEIEHHSKGVTSKVKSSMSGERDPLTIDYFQWKNRYVHKKIFWRQPLSSHEEIEYRRRLLKELKNWHFNHRFNLHMAFVSTCLDSLWIPSLIPSEYNKVYLASKTNPEKNGFVNTSLCEISPTPNQGFIKEIAHRKVYSIIYANDISQEVYDIVFKVDSSIQSLYKVRSIAVPFDNYPDFTYLYPSPDSIGERIIFYTNSRKIEQIIEGGVHAFVKYPEMQNKQMARIFFLTMVLSLLITGIINQIIKIYKDKKIRKRYVHIMNNCNASVVNCSDCPLKNKCPQCSN